MRLAAKLVLLYIVGLLLIVGLFSYLTLQNERRLAAAEHQRRAAELVAAMQPELLGANRNEMRRVLQTTTTLKSKRMKVRLVEPADRETGSVPPGVPIDVIVTRRAVTTIALPESDGGERLYTYVPVGAIGEDGQAAIEVSAPDEAAKERFQMSLWRSGVALVGVTLLSAAVILIGGIWMVGRPLDQLIEKVHRVGNGELCDPISVNRHDELGKLGTAINQMCEQLSDQRRTIDQEVASRLATLGQLRHADRLSTLGRLAAGVAHEMGTPLNVVSGRAELIASGELSTEETRRSATAIKHESDRIAAIIRSLLDFARRGTPNRQPSSLRPLIQRTLTLMSPLAEKTGIELVFDPSQDSNGDSNGDSIAEIDQGQIQQVLTNLIVNAIASMDGDAPTSARAVITIKLRTLGDEHKIDVIDQGHGIAPGHLDSIFEPFFTTKDVGQGTGLGLSIAHGIVEDHGGRIEVTSSDSQGTTFSVFLPGSDRSTTRPIN